MRYLLLVVLLIMTSKIFSQAPPISPAIRAATEYLYLNFVSAEVMYKASQEGINIVVEVDSQNKYRWNVDSMINVSKLHAKKVFQAAAKKERVHKVRFAFFIKNKVIGIEYPGMALVKSRQPSKIQSN